MAASIVKTIEADGAGLRALRPDAVTDRLLGILRHQALELGLGLFVLEVGWRGCCGTAPANSAQALDVLMSTIRTASIRGRGGSTPNRRGGSPVSTQRQNFFSAVSRRCW